MGWELDNRQTLVGVDLAELGRRLTIAAAVEEPAGYAVRVRIVTDAEIHRVNREFLDHDWPTDVVTFPADDEDAGAVDGEGAFGIANDSAETGRSSQSVLRGAGRWIEGDLIVSAETAAREASAHGWCVADELLLYCVHGWLHLCGYDDLSDEERPLMRARERAALAVMGLVPLHLED